MVRFEVAPPTMSTPTARVRLVSQLRDEADQKVCVRMRIFYGCGVGLSGVVARVVAEMEYERSPVETYMLLPLLMLLSGSLPIASLGFKCANQPTTSLGIERE